jgi:hypothetical protein
MKLIYASISIRIYYFDSTQCYKMLQISDFLSEFYMFLISIMEFILISINKIETVGCGFLFTEVVGKIRHCASKRDVGQKWFTNFRPI